MSENQSFGREAEEMAAVYLAERGYRLLNRNYRIRGGEIDLILESPEGILVFAEVKARHGDSCGTPAEAVDQRKQEKLRRTALHYLTQNHRLDALCRFDVVEILVSGNQRELRHHPDAFQ